MKVSTKGRYALRLLIEIGLHDDRYVRLKDAAKNQGISLKYLEQISNVLQKAKLLNSARGANGGYKLSKRANDYTVLEILEVAEGNMSPVDCLDDEINNCDRYDKCSTVEMWEGFNKVIKDYLSGIKLDELIDKEKKNIKNQIDYYI